MLTYECHETKCLRDQHGLIDISLKTSKLILLVVLDKKMGDPQNHQDKPEEDEEHLWKTSLKSIQ